MAELCRPDGWDVRCEWSTVGSSGALAGPTPRLRPLSLGQYAEAVDRRRAPWHC